MLSENKNGFKILIDDLKSIGMAAISSLIFGMLVMVIRNFDPSEKISKIYQVFNSNFKQQTENSFRFAAKSSFYLWLNAFLGATIKGKNSARGNDYNWMYSMLTSNEIDLQVKRILDSESKELAYLNAVIASKALFKKVMENIIVRIENSDFESYYKSISELREKNI